MMQAVLLKSFGGPDQMYIGETEKPSVLERPSALLVRVFATALNRADTLQRQGRYPPPPGDSEIIGLEVAGEVVEVGEDCKEKWSVGDRVCGLLGGGGYAQYCVMEGKLAMRIPDAMSYEEAACIPEAFMTSFQLLYYVGRLQEMASQCGPEEAPSVLLHAGASGIGCAATQLAKALPKLGFDADLPDSRALQLPVPRVFSTCGSDAKTAFCVDTLGADAAFNYRTLQAEDCPDAPCNFATKAVEATDGRGVSLILDPVGQGYFALNLQALHPEGAAVLYGWLSGSVVPDGVDLGPILRKRLRVEGTTLRARSLEYKGRLAKDVEQRVMPLIANGDIRLVIHTVMPWTDVVAAHAMMEANENIGKIVLRVE